MRGGSEAQGGGPPSRPQWPLVLIGLVLGWLLISGGRLPSLSILRGELPGTGGWLTVAHAVLLALILIIANFVLRMPREGGPLRGEDEPEASGRQAVEPEGFVEVEGEEIEGRGEFPETQSAPGRVEGDDRPVEAPSQDRGPSADG